MAHNFALSALCHRSQVSSLLKSHLDNGPQRHIRQPELRLFWATHFGAEAEVPWFAFWDAFPKLLAEVPGAAFDMAAVQELGRLLADESAQAAFQRAVERSNKDTVSVWELKVSFQGDDELLAQVARHVGTTAGTLAVAAAAASSSAPAATVAAAPKPSAAARCQLPPLPSGYAGRDDEAARIVEHLTGGGIGRSLLLLADGGMGKSCLAADVGWRLLQGGRLPAGALWVDLREASSAAEVEARFCASLDVAPVSCKRQSATGVRNPVLDGLGHTFAGLKNSSHPAQWARVKGQLSFACETTDGCYYCFLC